MKYEYSIENNIYYNEINDFLKKSVALKRIRKKQMVLAASFGYVLAIILFIKSVIENKYDRDFIYIFLEYTIIYIAAIFVVWLFRKIHIKFIENKTLIKECDRGYTHTLDIEDKKIYYGVDSEKLPNIILELNSNILQEVCDLDNILGIVISYEKNFKKPYAVIIIPKDIFKTEDELSEFKNLLENKL